MPIISNNNDNYYLVCKLFGLDRNTWYITVQKKKQAQKNVNINGQYMPFPYL